MFCPSCGVALAQQMKYCNRCGSNVNTVNTELFQIIEKRMDSEMEGLFWSTAFALGFVLGGIVVLKKLNIGEPLLIGYLTLCAVAYLSYFSLGVWQLRRLSRTLKQGNAGNVLPPTETNELPQLEARAPLETFASVTEHTTRTLEPVNKN